MPIQTVKLSDEILAKLGATPLEVEAKLAALLAENADASAKLTASQNAANAQTVTASTKFEERLSGVEESILKLTPLLNFDADKVVASAKAEASRLVAAALAKTGGAPIAAAAPPVAANPPAKDFKALVNEKIAAGKSKSAAFNEAFNEAPALYVAWKESGAGSL